VDVSCKSLTLPQGVVHDHSYNTGVFQATVTATTNLTLKKVSCETILVSDFANSQVQPKISSTVDASCKKLTVADLPNSNVQPKITNAVDVVCKSLTIGTDPVFTKAQCD
jgi:hypothetical protein